MGHVSAEAKSGPGEGGRHPGPFGAMLAALLLLGLLATPASAFATPTWLLPSSKLSDEAQSAREPQIAVDEAGDAVAVWKRSNGTNFVIEAATSPAGKGWSLPSKLSDGTQNAERPQIAVDAAGDAVAVWARSNSTHLVVEAATHPTGGGWSLPSKLSDEAQSAFNARVAIDAVGDAVAVWERSNGTHEVIEATRHPAGGNWSAPNKLSDEAQTAAEPQVAVDQAGDAVAVWDRFNGTNQVVEAAAHPAGGGWSVPSKLSDEAQSAGEPQIAVDQAGDAVAVWERSNGPNFVVEAAAYDAAPPRLKAVSIPSDGRVGMPLSFSSTAIDAFSPNLQTSWSFGDRATASGPSVTHAYAAPGSYEVALKVLDGVGNATSKTQTVTISPPARAARIVKVKGGKVLLRLSCPAAAAETPCRGTAKLSTARDKKPIVLASGIFQLRSGQQANVALKLNPKAKRLLVIPSRRLRAKLSGDGLQARSVILVAAGKGRGHRAHLM